MGGTILLRIGRNGGWVGRYVLEIVPVECVDDIGNGNDNCKVI